MNKKKNTLIPEIRFPEFLNEGEWKMKRLEKVCKINPKINHLPERFVYIDLESVEQGTLKQKKIINSEGAPSRAQRLLNNDDVIFQMVRPYQKNNYYFLKEDANEYVASTGYAQLRAFESSMYLYQLIHTDRFVANVLEKCTGSNYPAINSSDLSQILVQLPPSANEQQKIASCLSSLDEVIKAHSHKLDVLKDHKKCLMQNLFPQEGETVPKYRFPEFVNDEGWVKSKLGGIGEPLMCKRILKEQTNPKNGIPFYKIGTFGRETDSYIPIELYNEFKGKYSFPNIGDILISAAGTIGRLVVYDGSPAYFQDSNIVWLGNDEELVLNSFLFHYYSKIKWQTSDGGIISRLYNSDLKNMSINFPKGKTEQQKIAACLTTIDDLIAAQSYKIEQLKLHKKGLMQGLFPKVKA